MIWATFKKNLKLWHFIIPRWFIVIRYVTSYQSIPKKSVLEYNPLYIQTLNSQVFFCWFITSMLIHQDSSRFITSSVDLLQKLHPLGRHLRNILQVGFPPWSTSREKVLGRGVAWEHLGGLEGRERVDGKDTPLRSPCYSWIRSNWTNVKSPSPI